MSMSAARATPISIPVPLETLSPPARELVKRGYTVLPGVITDLDLADARHSLDGIFRKERCGG